MADDLLVRIDANTTGYDTAIARAQRETYSFAYALKQADRAAQAQQAALAAQAAALENSHRAMAAAGRGMVMFGGAVALGLGLAAKAAIDWESAWTGVAKVVKGTPEEMARLEEGLRGLATTLPTTHEEIANIAAAAGQLGVKQENIVGFTKTMVDLSQTTNLTADEAATSMARFGNIMKTPQGDVDRLGSSLVALGNQGASTEADILELGKRIAGSGQLIGLTEGEVLGFANAMSSLGIQAESGGTAISTTFRQIETAVGEGGDKLAGFAEIAGVSADAYARLWGRDAAAATQLFIEGLARVKQTGGNVYQTLDAVGITAARQTDTLLRMSGNADLLADSLKLGNKAWRDNTALVEEAARRYDTTESKMLIARNQMTDMGITLGETLLPAIGKTADFLGDMVKGFSQLPGPVKRVGVVLGVVTAAVALLGGAALIAIPKIAALNTAILGMSAGAGRSMAVGLSRTASFLGGPWGLAIGAGITALGIFASKQGQAARDAEALKATLDEQTGAITANTREWMVHALHDSGTLDAASRLGLDLEMVTDAALGNTKQIAALNDELARMKGLVSEGGRGLVMPEGAAGDITSIESAIGGTNDALVESRRQWELDKEAMGDAGDAAKGAGKKMKGTTDAWGEGAEAAGELTEEAESLADIFDRLNGVTLSQREASRNYEAALDDARAGLKKYVKEHGDLRGALNQQTAAGREMLELLDGLATANQDELAATEEAGASSKRLRAEWKRQHQDLIQLADDLGMTRTEAKKYAAEVDSFPKSFKTTAELDTAAARREMTGWKRDVELAMSGITDEDIKLKVEANAEGILRGIPGIQIATGGPVPWMRGAIAGRDSVNAMLVPDEHVVDYPAVLGAGRGNAAAGHRIWASLRRMARRGELPKYGDPAYHAAGGPVLSPSVRGSGLQRSTAIASAGAERMAELVSLMLSRAVSKFITSLPFTGQLGSGGVLNPAQLARGQGFARSQAGKPYIWGGVGPGGYDCSGAQSAVLNAARGQYPYQRLGSTGTMPWAGSAPGRGGYTIGWFTGSPGHTSGNIGGLNVESSGGAGFHVGGGAMSPLDGMFNGLMHYDKGGLLKRGWTLAYNGTSGVEEVGPGGRVFAQPGGDSAQGGGKLRLELRGPVELQGDLQITNWKTGEARFRGIVRDEADSRTSHKATLRRHA